MELAPVCFFVYNRLDCTRRTVQALQNNFLAANTDLYVFADGWKNDGERVKVAAVHDYVKQIRGFRSINYVLNSANKGCGHSIRAGIGEIINKYGCAIIVEDDIVTTPNFLDYMNQGLERFEQENRIFSIGGYTIPIKPPQSYVHDTYYGQRGTPWGWATWANRWNSIDWLVSDFDQLRKNPQWLKAFHEGGSDLERQLKRTIAKEIDGWDIVCMFHQFINDQKTVYPIVSLVNNIGFDKDATHSKYFNRFVTPQDKSLKRSFIFPDSIRVEDNVKKTYMHKYSFKNRLIDRMKHYLGIRQSS